MFTASDEKALLEQIDSTLLPKHIAIIMDGNGRWARQRHLPRIQGHYKGAKTAKRIIRCCHDLRIPYLTLYAFSDENWSRPSIEVNALMKLLNTYLDKELREMMDNDIQLRAIGNLDKLPEVILKSLQQTIEQTRNNRSLVLTLALSYSGRDEIIRGINKLIKAREHGHATDEEVTAESFSQWLDSAGYPDPDLLIRTSGELRISNYMLWQLAYSELLFVDTLWPDFDESSLLKAILDFQQRKRRFGGLIDRSGSAKIVEPNR